MTSVKTVFVPDTISLSYRHHERHAVVDCFDNVRDNTAIIQNSSTHLGAIKRANGVFIIRGQESRNETGRAENNVGTGKNRKCINENVQNGKNVHKTRFIFRRLLYYYYADVYVLCVRNKYDPRVY